MITSGYALFFLLALVSHRLQKDYQPGVQMLLDALLLNNVEMAIWMGLPLVIFVLAGLLRIFYHMLSGQSKGLVVLGVSLVFVYLALNLAGQTRGEVARLWLFLLPLASLLASPSLSSLTRWKTLNYIFFALLQLVTTYLMFKYQSIL